MPQQINKNPNNFLRSVGLTAVMAGSLVMSSQVNAASQCKGLDNTACGETASCSWVNAYERKDGRKVKGFCRTSTTGIAKKAAKKQMKSSQKR